MLTKKNEIISFALELIRRKSYSSFSYDDIARELKITKAAVHYHFKTKEALGLAVCKRIADNQAEQQEEALQAVFKGKHPWSIIEERILIQSVCCICPLVSLQTDYENLPKSIQSALADLVQAEASFIRSIVKASNPEADVNAVIVLVLGLKGAIQYRRVAGESFFKNLIDSARKQIYALIPEKETANSSPYNIMPSQRDKPPTRLS